MKKLWGRYNKKNGKRQLKKRSVLMYGLIVLVMVTTSFAAVQADHGRSGDSSAAGTWDGSGTSGDPYKIDTAEKLADLAADVNSGETYLNTYFQLTGDLYLTGFDAGDGGGWMPIGNLNTLSFRGNFDGGGYTIIGLTINRTTSYVGLFGNVGGGTIENLGVVNAYIKGSSGNVGGVAGSATNAKIENCYFTGTIDGSGSAYVGGVVGRLSWSSSMENCYAAGTVKGVGGVGGVVGDGGGPVKNCYSMCDVEGSVYVGGVAGDCTMVSNCYSTGSVTGNEIVGGVVGRCNGNLWNCYSTGSVTLAVGSTKSTVGGVIGFFNTYTGGTVENCFFLKEGGINKDLYGYYIDPDGAVGSGRDDNAEPIGDAEMRTQSTFPIFDTNTGKGWDFGSTGSWGIYPNDTAGGLCYGYPYIKTIDNFILITPDGGSMVYDGKSAPDPEWTADRTVDKSLFTGSLLYDPTPALDVGTYKITIGALYDPALKSQYYQLSFMDGIQYEIKAASAPSGANYTITASSDVNSTISPAGQFTVQSGSSKTFTYSANNGYHISSVTVNGKDLPQDQITGSYTFTNVVSNNTIIVKSAPGAGPSGSGTTITLTVDILGGSGTAEYRIGSGQYVSFTGSVSIPVGSNLYVSVVEDSGYSFVEWTGDANSSSKEVSFANVSSDIHLVAHLSNDNATGSAGQKGNFAVTNLILAILALLIGIIAIIAGVWRRKDDEKKSSGTAVIAGLLALIIGIVSIIVFFLTEDLSATMTSTDSWTVWMAVLFVVTVILAAISFWAGGVHKAKGKD